MAHPGCNCAECMNTVDSMTDWVLDCIDLDNPPELTPHYVAWFVAHNYDGGIAQFVKDGECY